MKTQLTLEYDGTPFAGWAAQPGTRTVQAEVERAIATILGEACAVTVAGRTDRGVHAWGQVCSYAGEALDPRNLNALLPAQIAILDSRPMAEEFDARRDARSRTYCYRLLNRAVRGAFLERRALWWGGAIDRDALDACAAALLGTHDFRAFTPAQGYHHRFERRVLSAQWRREGDLLSFWIEADAFMRRMNRILVGTMLEVASGRRAMEDFVRLLDGAPRSEAGDTAPAHGLYLAAVRYRNGVPAGLQAPPLASARR